jgi:WD40 repeat protein
LKIIYCRSYNYNIRLNEIKLIDTLLYKRRCILKVHSFVNQDNILLITMATDGLLNIWNVISLNDTIEIKNITINGQQNLSLHQSGINSFDIKILNNYEYILTTGGDDNLLNLLIFKIILKKKKIVSVELVSLWKTTSMHLAQITGIILI